MSVTKINADGWTFELPDGQGGWIPVKGIEDFDVSPTTTRADTTDFDSEGSDEHRVIRRGKAFNVNGHWLEDEANADRDPGQNAIFDLAQAVGSSAESAFRLTSPGGTTELCQATFEENVSGDKNDVTKFSYTVTRTGGSTYSPSSSS